MTSTDLRQIVLMDHLLENDSVNIDNSLVNKDDEEMESMRISLDWQSPSVSIQYLPGTC